VDFLVDFPRGYDLFRQRLPLAEKLSELLNRRNRLDPIPVNDSTCARSTIILIRDQA